MNVVVFIKRLCAGLAGLLILLGGFVAYAAPSTTPSFVATNVDGFISAVDDQDATRVSEVANVPDVKAEIEIEIIGGAPPELGETFTIGSCDITVVDLIANEDLNCSDDSAQISNRDSADTVFISAGEFFIKVVTLINVSDADHGDLDLSLVSPAVITATTVGTETATTTINFLSDGGIFDSIILNSSTNGELPVAQIDSVVIAGTPEVGDTYSVELTPSITATYTVEANDTDLYEILRGFTDEVQNVVNTNFISLDVSRGGFGGYDTNGDILVSSTTNSMIIIDDSPGTGFTIDAYASNDALEALEIEFTVADVEPRYEFTLTLEGTDYSYVSDSDDTETDVVLGLEAEINHPDITCVAAADILTCTANTEGISYSYATSAERVSSGGSGRRSLSNFNSSDDDEEDTSTTTTSIETEDEPTIEEIKALRNLVRSLIMSAFGTGIVIPQSLRDFANQADDAEIPQGDLSLGMTGDDVSLLQVLLMMRVTGEAGDNLRAAGATGVFGPLTQAALIEYQKSKGITPALGFFGPKTRAALSQ